MSSAEIPQNLIDQLTSERRRTFDTAAWDHLPLWSCRMATGRLVQVDCLTCGYGAASATGGAATGVMWDHYLTAHPDIARDEIRKTL